MNIENNKVVISREEYNSLLNLKEEHGRLQKQMTQLVKQNEILVKENEKLRKKLRKFINENTPSGALPWYLKQYQSSVNINIKEKKDEDKRRKDTDDKDKKANIRNKRSDKINERKELKLVTCPYCGCKVSQKNKISKRIIISLNLESSVRTTEYNIHHGYCPKCKRVLRPTIPNSLPNSKYSLDIFLMISSLSVGLNLTDRKISEFFFNIFGLSISPVTVCNMRLKLKNYLGNEYNVLEEKICDSSVSHTDESGWKKKSKNEWIVAVSSLKEVVYKIMKKRNMANAKKLPAGKVHISDGLPIYNESGEERQRCFAHLIRKIKNP